MDISLKGSALPIEGFRFLKSTKEMLGITREIENEIKNYSSSNSAKELYVGFQNVDKLYFEKNSPECTKEYLTKKMSNLASRATIINFINGEIDKGSLVTKISSKDKRVKIINPSKDLIDEFISWLDSDNRAT